jgi:hypothetical protein
MRKLLLAVVLLLVVAAVAVGVRTLGARDQADAVDAKDAAGLVADDEQDTGDVPVGDRPDPGTYTYAGSGRESVTALGGSEHVFPREIAVVVTLDPEDDCAWTSNVVYVKQHIEARRFCTRDGEVVDLGFTREIEFFNQLQETVYECGDDAVRLRPDAKPGDTWTWTCTQDGKESSSAYTATFIGTEQLSVGGEQVEAFHTKVASKQTGDTVGSDTSEFWLAESGLPLRFTADLQVTTKSVLGETVFREQLDYALTSLVPATD